MMPGAAKGAGKSFVRLLSYMKKYWLQLVLVLVCILVSAIAGVAGSTFLQTLIPCCWTAAGTSPVWRER